MRDPVASTSQINRRPLAVRSAYIFAFWTFLGLFFAAQMVISYISRGNNADWSAALVFQMSRWYAWGLLTPILLLLARRFGLSSNWRKHLTIHFLASLILAPLQVILSLILRNGAFVLLGTLSVEQVSSYLTTAPTQILTGSFDGFIIYWLILGIYYSIEYYQQLQERQIYSAQLESQLATAQLTALKMQLHPHFLFNTLHGVTALIRSEPETAERMIVRLSDLLRLTLENEGQHEVDVAQEVEFLETYLEIEKIRFADRLTVSMLIDPGALQARIPNLILQPIVENAIRHGIAPLADGGSLTISAVVRNDRLVVSVSDNGPGFSTGNRSEGLGLSNTRQRLRRLYPENHTLAISKNDPSGSVVTLDIPFSLAE